MSNTSKKSKILILCPKFHPLEDGLGQHTTHFYHTLKSKVETLVITSATPEIVTANQRDTDVYPLVEHWDLRTLPQLLRLVRKEKPTHLLIQWVPYLYAKRAGLNFSFPSVIRTLKKLIKVQVHLYCHELYYPNLADLKSKVLHYSHKWILKQMIEQSELVLTSTDSFKKEIDALWPAFQKKTHWIPVSSNINRKISITPKTPSKKVRIGLFGTFHPSKRVDLVLNSLFQAIQPKKEAYEIHYIGASEDEIKTLLTKEDFTHLSSFLVCTGFLKNSEVDQALQELDGFIAYFMDGLSSRRGSFLAALERGIPSISTTGQYTDSIFLNVPGLHLLSPEERAFQKGLHDLIQNGWPRSDAHFRNSLSLFYNDSFSWEKTTNDYLNLIAALN